MPHRNFWTSPKYNVLLNNLDVEAKKYHYKEVLRDKGHELPPSKLKRMKFRYNRYKLESLENGLFEDS